MIGLPRRFWVLFLVPLLLVAGGTLGYQVIEGWRFLDALFMTIITLSTIGYGETHELSDSGRVFTIFLILLGVFTFIYSATEMIRTVVRCELAGILVKQKMERTLAHLHDHIIVCGYGHMGASCLRGVFASTSRSSSSRSTQRSSRTSRCRTASRWSAMRLPTSC